MSASGEADVPGGTQTKDFDMPPAALRTIPKAGEEAP